MCYRVRPGSSGVANKLLQLCGGFRWMWNHLLSLLTELYYLSLEDEDVCCPNLSKYRLVTLANDVRKGVEWMVRDGSVYSSVVMRYVGYVLADAFARYFSEVRRARLRGDELYKRYADGSFRRDREGRKVRRFYPRYKVKGSKDSFIIPDMVKIREDVGGRFLRVPCVGYVELVGDNPCVGGVAKRVVVEHVDGKFYAVVTYLVSVVRKVGAEVKVVVGVDMNGGQVTDSAGGVYELPAEKIKMCDVKRRRYARSMSRKIERQKRDGRKGVSNRYVRERKKKRRWERKSRNVRRNWQHHVSKDVAGKGDVVAVEDLDVRGMTGKGGVVKRGLNRVILGTGWGELKGMLGYKAVGLHERVEKDKVVVDGLVKVDAAYTSQECSVCGYVDAGNRRTRDEFKCLECGFSCGADVNASRNIVMRGVEELRDGGYDGVVGRLGVARLDGERRWGSEPTAMTRQ